MQLVAWRLLLMLLRLLLHGGLVGDSGKVDVQEVGQLVNGHPNRGGHCEGRSVDLWRVDVCRNDDRCHRVDDHGHR